MVKVGKTTTCDSLNLSESMVTAIHWFFITKRPRGSLKRACLMTNKSKKKASGVPYLGSFPPI